MFIDGLRQLKSLFVTTDDCFDDRASLRRDITAKSALIQTLDQTIRDMERHEAWLAKELAQARERLDRIAARATPHCAPIGRAMAAIARGDA